MLSTRRRRTTIPQVVTLIAGSKRRSLLMAGDDNEMFMTRSLNITPKTTEQHLIARSDKSVASVTNNKRLCSTFCTISRMSVEVALSKKRNSGETSWYLIYAIATTGDLH